MQVIIWFPPPHKLFSSKHSLLKGNEYQGALSSGLVVNPSRLPGVKPELSLCSSQLQYLSAILIINQTTLTINPDVPPKVLSICSVEALLFWENKKDQTLGRVYMFGFWPIFSVDSSFMDESVEGLPCN